LAAGVPWRSDNYRQRLALARLAPNRTAAPRHDDPPSMAATTDHEDSVKALDPSMPTSFISIGPEAENSARGDPARFASPGNRSSPDYSPDGLFGGGERSLTL